MKVIKEIFRYSLVLSGLAGLGIIAAEMLRKWQIVDKSANPIWILSPIFILFFCKEIFNSSYIENKQIFSKRQTEIALKIINAILVIISILILISIPFIWYGTIEELAGKQGGGYRP
jgi:hypothetical protein